jgi:cyclophilin family peptidyl-prolyl cis-trans isomerase
MYPSADQAIGEAKASGSQFFVSFVQVADTGAPLATFGTVSSGMELLKELKEGDVVESIKISEK